MFLDYKDTQMASSSKPIKTTTKETASSDKSHHRKGYTTRYYRENRERESQRRLENYYKNRYGVEPDEIEAFKQKRAILKEETLKVQKVEQKKKVEHQKWERLYQKMKHTPNPYQHLLMNIPVESCVSKEVK